MEVPLFHTHIGYYQACTSKTMICGQCSKHRHVVCEINVEDSKTVVSDNILVFVNGNTSMNNYVVLWIAMEYVKYENGPMEETMEIMNNT